MPPVICKSAEVCKCGIQEAIMKRHDLSYKILGGDARASDVPSPRAPRQLLNSSALQAGSGELMLMPTPRAPGETSRLDSGFRGSCLEKSVFLQHLIYDGLPSRSHLPPSPSRSCSAASSPRRSAFHEISHFSLNLCKILAAHPGSHMHKDGPWSRPLMLPG